jgi:hypothetical protein
MAKPRQYPAGLDITRIDWNAAVPKRQASVKAIAGSWLSIFCSDRKNKTPELRVAFGEGLMMSMRWVIGDLVRIAPQPDGRWLVIRRDRRDGYKIQPRDNDLITNVVGKSVSGRAAVPCHISVKKRIYMANEVFLNREEDWLAVPLTCEE